ncbi:hypothetical protein LCGC14_0791060, partial [marine sediment metagenome]
MAEEKIPPHDIDCEEAVNGSLLIDGEAFNKIATLIQPSDFYTEVGQFIYRACGTLQGRREAINQITVAQELDREGKLGMCGGAAYLSHLISIVPTSLDIEHYAQIVKRLSVSRRAISLGGQIAMVGYEARPDVNDGINTIVEMVNDFRKINVAFDDIVTPADAGNILIDLINEYNDPQHTFSWGFRDLDDITSGIYPELIIIGARPGVGKTQLMLDVADKLYDRHILFCSAEMSTKALLERKLAKELGTDIRQLRRQGLDDGNMDRVVELSGRVSEQQIYYLPNGCSSQDIYHEAKKMKDTVGLDIVFVDYLQLLSDCWRTSKENQNIRVGRACKVLNSIKNDLQVPVVVASQLNRSLELRAEKRPNMADLRDSGEIEQDADVILLLYRDMEDRDD